MTRLPKLGLRGLLSLYAVMAMSASLQAGISWGKLHKQPDAWYATDEAAGLADAILAWQTPSGGWPKNIDMSAPPAPEKLDKHAKEATIDNGATTSQLQFLGKLIEQHREERWLKAFERGFDYLLEAQYPNGGWPQFYPLKKGYYTHITFNDNATANVLRVLRAAADGKSPYSFVDAERRAKAATAFDKGIDCVLRCQVVIDGVKTAWGAQHDETTFEAAPARKFEPISLCSRESFELVEILMEIPNPSPAIIEAVEAAIAWAEKSKITGIRYEKVPYEGHPGQEDKVVIEDPSATEPLWARFYEIPSNRPLFMGRDSVPHYALAEIEHERRMGYGWYSTEGRSLLKTKYPKWRKRLGLK